MPICEACLQAIPNKASRGPLTAIDAPPRVFHDGKALTLSPAAARLLIHLIRFRRASRDALASACIGEDAEDPDGMLWVLISHVRKALPSGARIVTIYRWGYELVVE